MIKLPGSLVLEVCLVFVVLEGLGNSGLESLNFLASYRPPFVNIFLLLIYVKFY
jgi:hypothetical protein